MRAAAVTEPFAQLSSEEMAASDTATVEEGTVEPEPIVPVPDDAPTAMFRHVALGEATATWSYRDEKDRLLFHVVRFDTPDGKQILPRSWCRLQDGSHDWRWRGLPVPRPLYGLRQLAVRRDEPVLIVEGEKAADAGQRLFPGYVAVTWPGGANAVGKADWSVLSGRRVVVWPDADPHGRRAANEVARRLTDAGTASVAVVQVPRQFPGGWDLADPAPEGTELEALLAAAREVEATTLFPDNYVLHDDGLYWRDPEGKKPDLHLAGPFRVLAETRDGEGTSWGVLLEWYDNDHRRHRLPVPRAMLAGDGADVRRLLLDGGLFIASTRGARDKLTACLAAIRSSGRVTATSRIGWHGPAFVFPDGCVGGPDDEALLLQGAGAVEHAFRVRGTLDQWRDQVARYAVGNSRLAISISAAFAAALVTPCEFESGGLHLRGASSIGKSTALLVAGSVWGGGEVGYIRSWRATSNGLEGVALGHCDALLCLDELSQVSARDAGEVAYMLANGAGKSRSSRDGFARRVARWRLLFLSSGEIGLADKVAEDGRKKRLAAGQEVRVVDIPGDARAGLGLFEALHGSESAEALARHLRRAATMYYGVAARRFLQAVADDLDGVRQAVSNYSADFLGKYVPAGADGQVHRVAQRFALIAAAGEIAAEAGVLPWPAGEATRAAAQVYRDWIDIRGGVEPSEVRNGIEQVQAFIQSHGMARFAPAWEDGNDVRPPMREIAGFRKREAGDWDYYVTPSAWKGEVCTGFDGRALAAILAERKLLIVTDPSRRSRTISVPNYGKVRIYHLSSRLMEFDPDA